jgi:hypothetical protein
VRGPDLSFSGSSLAHAAGFSECACCGSRHLRQQEISGYIVYECDLCGELHGRADDIETIKAQMDAEDLGIEKGIWPLVRTINKIDSFRTFSSCEGHPDQGVLPHVSFYIQKDDMGGLEKLAASLEMAKRKTAKSWRLEVMMESQLGFVLRPNVQFVSKEGAAREILTAQRDVLTLSKQLERDMSLSWWHA